MSLLQIEIEEEIVLIIPHYSETNLQIISRQTGRGAAAATTSFLFPCLLLRRTTAALTADESAAC